ncbi:MAG TPA: hypothetical protein VFF53_02080 [Geobacteraceae bacterium]|nr:hypothetical protein [Geobacteraceae bacterium]
MGISTVIASALKGVSWQKIAGLAMEYGPEFYRQARGRFNKDDQQPEQHGLEVELQERVDRLEKLLVEQEEIISKQVAEGEQLKELCLKLEERLKVFKTIAAALAVTTLILAVMMLSRG